jgi:hypothetical protein
MEIIDIGTVGQGALTKGSMAKFNRAWSKPPLDQTEEVANAPSGPGFHLLDPRRH